MEFVFNPADIQSTGIGIAALLSTVLGVFVYLSARHEELGKLMWMTLAASSMWAWFGFFYHIVPDLWWAREFRVVSVGGIVWINVLEFSFAVAYLRERLVLPVWVERARYLVWSGGVVFSLLLLSDLFGTHFIVGKLTLPPSVVLAPAAGPLLSWLIAYYMVCVAFAGFLFAWRARIGADVADRRRALWLFASMTVGLTLGGTRFTPWYGFDFYPLVGDAGFPLVTFAILYAMQRYRLLNVQVAAAQALVLALWTFSFFRVLLDKTLVAAAPDIAIFAAVLFIGIFLIRSVVVEIRTQKELAAITVDKMKSEFVTIAAHQLRTPLSAVRWSLSLLLTDTAAPLSAAQRSIAEKGARAADNMMAIANDLLNVARITSGKFRFDIEEGDVRDTVRVATGLLEEQARAKGVKLSARLPATMPLVNFDRGKLAFALENIIDNAIKYTPEGGDVIVEASTAGGRVALTVRDTGIGIPAADKPRMFEKFFRGKEAVRMSPDGSGLGLFITKTIVDGHGGTVTVSSEEGHGTTVTITLPTAASSKA